MTPPEFLRFFKTKSGKLVLFGAVFAGGLTLFSVYRERAHKQDEINSLKPLRQASKQASQPQTVHTVERPGMAFHPPAVRTAESPVARAETNSPVGTTNIPKTGTQQLAAPAAQKSEPQPLPSISLLADASVGIPEPKKLGPVFAPYGRLISCETVITVDSASIQTPIIGLVTEDVYHAGKLVIPAGTEVHGSAQVNRQRDRIASSTSWTFIWQTGEQLQIKAIALDREFSGDHEGWGITDGSAGLRGRLIKTDDMADIKLFAATFLSGAAGALTEKQQTIFGPVTSPSLNNAPFEGAQAVLAAYAQRIYDTIQRDGFYVRVPSGTQFYLYVLQTIDRADAVIGGSPTLASEEAKQPASPDSGAIPASRSTPAFTP